MSPGLTASRSVVRPVVHAVETRAAVDAAAEAPGAPHGDGLGVTVPPVGYLPRFLL